MAADVVALWGREWRKGDRLRLAETEDQVLPAGVTGTVVLVDAVGTVHVRWDDFAGVVSGLVRGVRADDGDVVEPLGVPG